MGAASQGYRWKERLTDSLRNAKILVSSSETLRHFHDDGAIFFKGIIATCLMVCS